MKPLDGVLVVAVEQAVAGPFCTQQLANAGARVIKVEREDGDFARHYDSTVHGHSAYFVWLNRRKESVCLNIKDRADGALLNDMIMQADVFVQNLGPGSAARNGLDSAHLRTSNPRLVTCDISGYGSHGPKSGEKAYDLLIQAESGLASITGRPEGPGRVGVSVCDIAAGLYAYVGILEALIARSATGQGSAVEVSLFDVMVDWMTVPLLQQAFTGGDPQRLGLHHPSIAPYGAYKTKTGPIVLAVQNDREWTRLCEAVLGEPELARDSRFRTNSARVEHRSELDEEINRRLSDLPGEVVVDLLSEAGIATGSINTAADVWEHPQLRLGEASTELGKVRMPWPALQVPGGSDAADQGHIPELGEHTEAIRAEFS